jgi:hypothetical protein
MFPGPVGDDPQSAEVKRLAVRPGDRIVVRLDHEPSDAEWEGITRALRKAFEGLEYTPPVIVLGPGMEIGVIGPEADGA